MNSVLLCCGCSCEVVGLELVFWSLVCRGVISLHIEQVVDLLKLIISQCSQIQLGMDVVSPLRLSHLVHLCLSAWLSAMQILHFHGVGVASSCKSLLVHSKHVASFVRLTF